MCQPSRGAKTTNTAHIAAALGRLGRQVLAWALTMNYGSIPTLGFPLWHISV